MKLRKREIWKRFKAAVLEGRAEEAARLYEEYLKLLPPSLRGLWMANLTIPESLPYRPTIRPSLPIPIMEPKAFPRYMMPELLRKPEFFAWYKEHIIRLMP